MQLSQELLTSRPMHAEQTSPKEEAKQIHDSLGA